MRNDLNLDLAQAAMAVADDAIRAARVAAARGDAGDAREALAQALANGSPLQVAIARVELAFVELELEGHHDEARYLLGEADKLLLGTDDCDFLLRLASGWRAVADPMLAARAYRRVLDVVGAPQEPPTHDQRVDWDPPLDGLTRYLMALSYFRLGQISLDTRESDPEAAKAYLDEAHKLGDPNVSPFACLELAGRLADLQTPQQNERLLNMAIAYDHPEASPQAGFELGVLLIGCGLLDKASESLTIVRDESGHELWAPMASEKLSEIDALMARPRPAPPSVERERPVTRRPRKILIVGAGTGGQYLYGYLEKVIGERYEVVGFVDDNPYADGVPSVPHETRVLGRLAQIRSILAETMPHMVWLAMPTAPPARKRKVALACADHGVPLKILPNMHEIALECNLIPQLRDVRIDDLMGDGEVLVDHHAASWLRARRVMIIGGGMLGEQLARKAADSDADRIVIVDRDDHALVNICRELDVARGFRRTRVRKGSAVDARLLLQTAAENRCDVIFYAAVSGWSNVGGDIARQRRILRGLLDFTERLPEDAPSVSRLVWASHANVAVANTPARALAAVAEAIVLSSPHSEALVRCAVRVPTIYTSHNSIIWALKRQIALGIPLRVPPPPALQRFMHAYEAAELMLRAGEIGRPGEAFSLDSGEDVSVQVLAEEMLRLEGMIVEQEVKIEEAPELAIDEAPREHGAETEIPHVLSLGRRHDVDRLRKKVQELLTGEAGDIMRFARESLPRLDSGLVGPAPVEHAASAPVGDYS